MLYVLCSIQFVRFFVFRMFFTASAIFIANQFLLMVELVFAGNIVLALAGLTDESDGDVLFFLGHGAIIIKSASVSKEDF